ncbi:hypothetical protein D3C83_123710 [compost metagenome]
MDVAHRIDSLARRDRRRGHGVIAREDLTKSLKHRNPGDPSNRNAQRCKMDRSVAQTTLSLRLM